MADQRIRWAAQIEGVGELSLLGSADAPYWRSRFAGTSLEVAEVDGRAQILLIAARLRFAGVSFREVSISVFVSRVLHDRMQTGAFLLQTYNSNRLFAFCERTLFSTPYNYGRVDVAAEIPGAVTVDVGRRCILDLHFAADSTDGGERPIATGDAGWEGPVFLPGRRPQDDARRYFAAKLHGLTHASPFLPDRDRCELLPGPTDEAVQSLVDSNFSPRQWSLRANAFHAKSKTYDVD